LRYSFDTEQWVPYRVDRVFAFFADPMNLPALMPQCQKARIEQARLVPPPIRPDIAESSAGAIAGEGSEMTISFRPLPFSPIRISWQARIVEFEWNDHFCDEQPRGPFQYWRHCHYISEATRGEITGSMVKDALVYELPLGILGGVAQRIFVGRQVKAIFAFRQKRLLENLAAR